MMNDSGNYLKRPFAVIGAVFFFITWFLSTFGFVSLAVILPLLFVISAFVIIFRFRKKFIVFIIIFAVAVSACLCYYFVDRDYENKITLSGKGKTVCATVLETPFLYDDIFIVRINSIDGVKTDIKARISIDDNDDDKIELYDNIECRANLYNYSEDEDIENNFRSDGIYLSGYSLKGSLNIRKSDSHPLMYYITKLKYDICNGIYNMLPNDYGGFIIAIVLGEKGFLSDTVIHNFKVCGISHLMAVSGLHTYIWSTCVIKFFSLFMSKRKSSVFAILFLVFFMMLTGFTPSVVRAGVMMICVYAGDIFRRRPDSLNSLGLSLFIILLINPFAAVNIGLLLSYSAALGLIVCSEKVNAVTLRVKEKINIKYLNTFVSYIVSIILVSLTALVFTLPVSVFYMGSVSLLSLIANIISVDIGMFIMIIGGISVIFMPLKFTEFLSYPFLFVSGLLSKFLLKSVGYLSKLDFLYVSLDYFYVKAFIIGVLFCIGILYLFVPKVFEKKWAVVLLSAVSGLLFSMIGICYNILTE